MTRINPINPKDLKPGQRVRVTFDATVDAAKGNFLCLQLVKGTYSTFWESEFPALTCKLLPDPIEVGDKVRYGNRSATATGTVLAIHNNSAWVIDKSLTPATWFLENLTKIEGDA